MPQDDIDTLGDLADKWEREADAADEYAVEKARLNCAFELREFIEQKRRERIESHHDDILGRERIDNNREEVGDV